MSAPDALSAQLDWVLRQAGANIDRERIGAMIDGDRRAIEERKQDRELLREVGERLRALVRERGK